MSSSIYRGKLITSSEIKGPFTEAADNIKGVPFNTLVKAAMATGQWALDYTVHEGNFADRVLHIHIGGILLTIGEDGSFEISEGAA
jgi:hypothetical protein